MFVVGLLQDRSSSVSFISAEYTRYCDTVEKTAEWGGEPEVSSFSSYLCSPMSCRYEASAVWSCAAKDRRATRRNGCQSWIGKLTPSLPDPGAVPDVQHPHPRHPARAADGRLARWRGRLVWRRDDARAERGDGRRGRPDQLPSENVRLGRGKSIPDRLWRD